MFFRSVGSGVKTGPVRSGLRSRIGLWPVSVWIGLDTQKFSKMRDFERPFTPQTWLRSASNFGKTHFRRFPTLHFLMPNICFWMCTWDLFFGFKKFTRNWKTAVFEELGFFWRHRQLRLEKWPPMKLFSGLYDIWRRGKRLRFDFWSHFSPKSDFHKKVIYVITKLRSYVISRALRSYEIATC